MNNLTCLLIQLSTYVIKVELVLFPLDSLALDEYILTFTNKIFCNIKICKIVVFCREKTVKIKKVQAKKETKT